MRTGFLLPLLLVLAGSAVRAAAQVPARAPGGVLRGVVQDSATHAPVSYALVVVVGKDQQTFTAESGRFILTGLPPGKGRIRIQQIGYRARTLTLDVDNRAGGGDASSELVIRLQRQAVVLPEISVEGKSCLGMRDLSLTDSSSTILSEAYQNAERILMLERKYPFVLEFQRVVSLLDSSYSRIDGRVDTLVKDSRTYVPYRAGKVLERGLRREHLNAFTSSDFAGDEFQKTHCFWYAGRDSVEGFPGYRIDFTPKPEITSPDWAGSMLVDSASMALLRTETRLVNLPSGGTDFLSANCTIFYQPIVPSLPQEYQVRCVSAQRGGPPHFRVERWLLINRQFVGKTPVEPERPH
ncbi:MAG TPA: carboxypeptidase regulatory-like domain-containing protein [Gemmatimonadales bacterium]|nr:carboxypeptidase regulatory-like domain-containing protein [Gemmatimonadales bacterium]